MKKLFGQVALIVIGVFAFSNGNLIGQLQQTVPLEQWGRGYQGFVTIAASRSLVFSDKAVDQDLDKKSSLLVLIGHSSAPIVNLSEWLADGGSLLVAVDQTDDMTLRDFGLKFMDEDWRVYSRSDAFGGFFDCPVIRTLERSHPVTRGIKSIVSNQPAILTRSQDSISSPISVIAQFPQLTQRRTGQVFAAVYEHESGGRLLAVADPSIFCNQMLSYGDNARFALQAIDWLREVNRTNFFMIIDGQYSNLAGLDQTQIQLPPPTRDEVMDALRNLPADKLIEFGNTVATMVEDEGLVNEFVNTVTQEAPELLFRQFLITCVTVIIGFWLWFSYFSRDSLLEVVYPEGTNAGSSLTRKQRRELAIQQRVWAAKSLLERFLVQVTGEGLRNSEKRISEIRFKSSDGSIALAAKRDLKKAIRALEKRKPAWWKRRRLLQLEFRVAKWSQLHQQGILVYDGYGNTNTGTSKK